MENSITPQEKAVRLLDYFMDLSEEQEYNTPRYMSKEMAKQCALIAVDEILDALKIFLGKDKSSEDVVDFASKRIIYWQEVKQEIEKL